MKELRLAAKIIRMEVKDHLHYPDRLIADTFAMAARCGILLLLYAYVFKLRGGQVNGVPYDMAAWSMFLYFAVSTFNLRSIAREIARDVKSGNVETLFSKPVSYLLYRAWWQIGHGLYSFTVVAVLGVAAMVLTVGLPATMSWALFVPTLILAFAGCTVLTLALYTLIGLLAFWLEEINSVYWIVDKMVMILGGSYLPIALLPPVLYQVALYSPMGAAYFITHTPYETWAGNWPWMLALQAGWIIVCGLAVMAMFVRVRHRVSVNGG